MSKLEKEKVLSHRSKWLGGLVTALAFLIVAPAAFGYNKPDVNVIKDGSVANIQQQIANQSANLSQDGTATSGSASSDGGYAEGGSGGSGGTSVSKIDNSSNASNNTGACQKAGCQRFARGKGTPNPLRPLRMHEAGWKARLGVRAVNIDNADSRDCDAVKRDGYHGERRDGFDPAT